MNNCNFTGRITADIELKTTANGIPVVSFCMAVKRPLVKDKTDFINFVAYRATAEYLSKYASKGCLIGASGVLTSRPWMDKQGNNHVAFEIICDRAEVLKSAGNGEGGQTPSRVQNAQINYYNSSEPPAGFEPVTDDDEMPF